MLLTVDCISAPLPLRVRLMGLPVLLLDSDFRDILILMLDAMPLALLFMFLEELLPEFPIE